MIRAIGAYSLSECMEIMSELVFRAEKADEKKRNIVFCEDRLTLIAERAMTEKLGGSFRSYVTTYARALKTRGKVLSKQGSVMVIDGIVAALQKEGRLCRFVHGVPRGTAKSLYETIAQLAASAVDEEMLEESARLLEDGVLKDKVKDIAAIYTEYRKFLRENAYVDESGYLALLPGYLKSSGALCGADVYFLCYGSFTAQAIKAVKAAFEAADNVTGIFCYGKEDFYTGAAWNAFLRAAEEYGEKPQTVFAGTPLSGEAEILREGLFDPVSFSRGRKKYETDAIRLFEAEDKNDEAEKAAAAIRKCMAEDPSVRYRDFAVLTSDVKGYTLAFKKAFSEYGIPYFLDEKRSLKSHPLSAFLLACFETVRTGFLPENVDALLQNPFFGDADDYRNYLLKFANYRGGAKKEIRSFARENGGEGEEDSDDRVNYSDKNGASYDTEDLKSKRGHLLSLLSPIAKQASGKDYCAAVREILRLSSASEKLKELCGKVKDVALKEYLGQIENTLDRVLTEAETLLGGREMTVSEFENVLSDGLDATEISLIPVKSDAVFVGDINESRIEKVRVLFAVGMDESVPKNTSDTALISDREIEKLAEVKAKMEPTVAEVNLRGREAAALNLCTFTHAAYFSYALAADGSEPALSEVFRYLDALFCEKGGGKLSVKKGKDEKDLPFYCSAFAPALKTFYEMREADEKNGNRFLTERNALERALFLFAAERKAAFPPEEDGESGFVENGERLFFHGGKVSPSALETYFSCPFRHFLRYGLRLKEREEQTVMATDSGNFIHELLQRTAGEFEGIATESEARDLAQKTGENLLKKPPYSYGGETLSGAYAASRLLKEGVEAASAVFRQLKGSLYHVAATEKNVETKDFRGQIDRVDIAGDFVRIVDYKTGSIDDAPATYYTGRKLQLQLYMTAAKEDKIPAGVFYFPASLSFSDDRDSIFRMKGFFCGDADALTAGDVILETLPKGEESAFFEMKNGSARNMRAMDRLTFSDFVDYSVYVSETARNELKEGFIGVSPYEGACTFCPYGGACGFDKGKAFCRKANFTIDPKGIASIVRKEREEQNTAGMGGENDTLSLKNDDVLRKEEENGQE